MDDEPVLRALGELIVTWNSFEDVMGEILKPLLGQNPAIDAVIAEMGPVTLCNAILAATEYLPDDFRGHIEHAVEGFEIYRGYRNYYVHGVRGTVLGPDDVHAEIRQTTGKGQLRIFEDEVSSTALMDLAARIDDWVQYADIIGGKIPKARAGEPQSLPDKPPLPDKLQKRRQSPQDMLRLLRSSPP